MAAPNKYEDVTLSPEEEAEANAALRGEEAGVS
jgi:hypothetical protein